MIDGLDPSNEAEAVRRYKAHLDERDKPKPSEPKRCSFCLQPASDGRIFNRYSLICETCTKEVVAIFSKQRKRR